MNQNIDLFEKFPLLKKIVKLRSFQFLVILPNFILFYFFILAGLFGSPVGNRNIIIVFVWIFWWFMLIAFMVPFGSRIWCTVCPLPALGEWLQRMSLIRIRPGETIKGFQGRFFGRNLPWPKRFQNIWLQNIGFLILACFSGFLVTRPIVSVLVLGGMIVISTILALIYRMRSFCMYLCPVSGFLGLYSMTAKLALRRKDPQLCKAHNARECYLGTEKGYPCAWFQNVCTMTRNNYCGLCFECVKNCQSENIGLFWRPFCADKEIKGLDEAYKAFIMLGLAVVYSLNFLGPWGLLKDWANFTESGKVLQFGLLCLGIFLWCLAVLPGIYSLFIGLSKTLIKDDNVSFKKLFIAYSYSLVPFGLLSWIAFSVSLIMVNGSYIISVISDPLGWGWNLFGTADMEWRPFLPQWVPYIQSPLLLLGLFYSLKSAYEIGSGLFTQRDQVIKSLLPLAIFLVGITIIFLRLYAG